jgi:hypothetical protein
MIKKCIKFHLVGCMVFNGPMSLRVYFTTPNIQNDADLTIIIIHHILTHWSSDIFQVMILQLDNTSCENN